MAISFYKVTELPSALVADSLYFVREGAGFDLHVTDHDGTVAYTLNLPEGGGLGNAEVNNDWDTITESGLYTNTSNFTGLPAFALNMLVFHMAGTGGRASQLCFRPDVNNPQAFYRVKSTGPLWAPWVNLTPVENTPVTSTFGTNGFSGSGGRNQILNASANRTVNLPNDGNLTTYAGKEFNLVIQSNSAANRVITMSGSRVLNGADFEPVTVTDTHKCLICLYVTAEGIIIKSVTEYDVT